jgi:hypothetical protein
MKTILCVFLLFPVLFTPALATYQTDFSVKADSLQDDSAHFRQAQDFLNEHKEVIKKSILATFDLDLSTDEQFLPLVPKILEKIESFLDWDHISAQMGFILIQTFTPEELSEISEFMKTETGKKFMKFNPVLVSYFQETGLFISLKHQEEIETAIKLMLDQ